MLGAGCWMLLLLLLLQMPAVVAKVKMSPPRSRRPAKPKPSQAKPSTAQKYVWVKLGRL